jgi:small subunit ribosomal protein S20
LLALANHESAIKRAKQNEKRRLRNRIRKTQMKNAIKSVEEAVASNSPELAAERLQEAISVINKTAVKGVIHKNKASRKISRLTRKVNALSEKQVA